MTKCIAAFTETRPASYPAFINIGWDERLERVIIMVRNIPNGDKCGEISEVALTKDEWKAFVAEINSSPVLAEGDEVGGGGDCNY